jgi:hypothetical protein
LRFELKPSRKLAVAIVAAHALAAAAVLIVLPGAAGIAIAAALVALGLIVAWRRALLGSDRAVRAIAVAGDQASLELANGERFTATLAARGHVNRYMVTLPLGGRTILVTPDMLGRDSFRALRIWALWGKLPGVAGKQLGA